MALFNPLSYRFTVREVPLSSIVPLPKPGSRFPSQEGTGGRTKKRKSKMRKNKQRKTKMRKY
jgi:hypothetical protein